MKSHHVKVGALTIGNDLPLTIIAGPCQMESRAHALEVASALKEIAAKAGLGLIYKSSFDKANRTSVGGKRGLGLKDSLPVFIEIKEKLGLPTLTDIHEIEHCVPVAEVVDFNGTRSQLPRELGPGEQCRVQMTVDVPSKAGR